MRDLGQGVNACIGTSGSPYGMCADLNPVQRRFDRPLHRGLIGLTLPPREGGAVIFDFQGIS